MDARRDAKPRPYLLSLVDPWQVTPLRLHQALCSILILSAEEFFDHRPWWWPPPQPVRHQLFESRRLYGGIGRWWC